MKNIFLLSLALTAGAAQALDPVFTPVTKDFQIDCKIGIFSTSHELTADGEVERLKDSKSIDGAFTLKFSEQEADGAENFASRISWFDIVDGRNRRPKELSSLLGAPQVIRAKSEYSGDNTGVMYIYNIELAFEGTPAGAQQPALSLVLQPTGDSVTKAAAAMRVGNIRYSYAAELRCVEQKASAASPKR